MEKAELLERLGIARRGYLEDKRIEGLERCDNFSSRKYDPLVELPSPCDVIVDSQWNCMFSWPCIAYELEDGDWKKHGRHVLKFYNLKSNLDVARAEMVRDADEESVIVLSDSHLTIQRRDDDCRFLSVQRVYAEVSDDGAEIRTQILALRFREEDVTDAFNHLSAMAGQTAEFWL